jgi:myo-inositol 2-dehydrogenase/D-chiro-inositol 1-dehydrogenase
MRDCAVHGFDDTAVAGWDQSVPIRNVDPHNDFPAGPAHRFFIDCFAEAFRAELAAFVRVVAAAPACTVADAVEAAGWPRPEAATESLRRHAPVHIEEVRA